VKEKSQLAQKARALSLRPKWLPPRKRWPPCCPTYFQAAAPLGPWTEDGRSVPERRALCALLFARSLDIRSSARLFVLLPAVRSTTTCFRCNPGVPGRARAVCDGPELRHGQTHGLRESYILKLRWCLSVCPSVCPSRCRSWFQDLDRRTGPGLEIEVPRWKRRRTTTNGGRNNFI
jgi:hypothetical protein